MLENPSPDDWLMYSRTYDAQRFSPLEFDQPAQREQLQTAWTRTWRPETTKAFRSCISGVMYLIQPGATVSALDATNGTLLWEYKRDTTLAARTKTLAIYATWSTTPRPTASSSRSMQAPGKLRWETKTDGGMTSGPVVADGKVHHRTHVRCETQRTATSRRTTR